MKTEGIVTGLAADFITVSVVRTGSCGGNCASCAGCNSSVMRVDVPNTIGARIGDRVLLQSSSASILRAAFLIYILPIIFIIAVFAKLTSMGAPLPVFAAFAVFAVIGYILILKFSKIGSDITVSAVKIISRYDDV